MQTLPSQFIHTVKNLQKFAFAMLSNIEAMKHTSENYIHVNNAIIGP